MKAIFQILLLFFLTTVPALALDMQQLVREVEQQYWGVSSRARVTMEVRTANWQRSLEMESWSLGRERFITRILKPAKEKGVATLKVDNEVWNYLPKVDRTMKIPPSMMGGAWMGSHITNDDLVKGNKIDEEYSFTLLEETEEYWRVEGIPKPDAAVVWGKIIYQIHKATRTPQVVEYFDEEGIRVRRTLFDQLTPIGDRILPMRMEVIPDDTPEEKTVMLYRQIQFDVDVDESFFSLRRLKVRR